MKSEHRHELRTNELAEWIANFPQWLHKNRRTIIYVTVVIVAVIASYIWSRYQKNVVAAGEKTAFTELVAQIPRTKAVVVQASTQGTDNAFFLLDAAKKFRNIAEQTRNNELAAMAYIKEAELIREELLYRNEMPRQDEIATQIEQAQAAYTKAAEKAAGNPSLLAAAKFGLGLCEEELGNFQAARDIYKQIADDPAFRDALAAVEAKNRLDTMADYQTRVAFAPAPVKPAAQPQIELPPMDSAAPPVQLFQTPPASDAAPATPDVNSPAK